MVSITRQPTTIAAALLSTVVAATTNEIAFIPRRRHAFAVPSKKISPKHHSPTFIDAGRLIPVRGGSQENDKVTDGIENSMLDDQDEMDDVSSIIESSEKEVDASEPINSSSLDSAWDEEIKRLQDYLNSEESRSKSSVRRDGVSENADVYGASEDVSLLGSGATAIDVDDSESVNVMDDESYYSEVIPNERSELLDPDELMVDRADGSDGDGDTIINGENGATTIDVDDNESANVMNDESLGPDELLLGQDTGTSGGDDTIINNDEDSERSVIDKLGETHNTIYSIAQDDVDFQADGDGVVGNVGIDGSEKTSDKEEEFESLDPDELLVGQADGSYGGGDTIINDEDSERSTIDELGETKTTIDSIAQNEADFQAYEDGVIENVGREVAINEEDEHEQNTETEVAAKNVEEECGVERSDITVLETTKDMDEEVLMRDTEIITDQHVDILAADESDIDINLTTHHPAAVNAWKSPPTAAESNRLVEDGLSKLRRKDGDHPSVPYVITRAMKRVLINELGYEEDEVKSMRADVAVVIVSENLRRPSIATLPSRFYHEDVEPVQQMDSLRDVLMNKVQSFVQKIDLKQGLAVLGSVVACSLFAVVKGLHGEDVTAGEIISMDESINTGDGKSDEQEPDKVETERQIPRSDLDKNWFDRLISMITFFK